MTLWRAAFVMAVLGILYLALRQTTGEADWFWQADKVRHAFAFATLWWLGWRSRWLSPWALALALFGFGVSIELLQSLTPTREPSALDVCADAAGLLLGVQVTRRVRPAT